MDLDTCDIANLPRKMYQNMFCGKIFRIRTCPEFVYDGDTLDVCFEFNGQVLRDSLRIKGYDSPELKTKNPKEKAKGKEAKQFLKKYIGERMDKPMFVLFDGSDKWGRLLGELYVHKKNRGGTITNERSLKAHCDNISDVMVSGGYGYAYQGGTKRKFD